MNDFGAVIPQNNYYRLENVIGQLKKFCMVILFSLSLL